MQPATYHITVWANGAYARQIAFADSTGAPYDLTGWLIEMQVRNEQGAAGAAEIDIDATGTAPDDRIEVLDAENGVVVIHISEATLTDLMSAGEDPVTYSYDIRMGADADSMQVFVRGDFKVQAGVTR